MDRTEALRVLLQGKNPRERLDAARYLARHATPEDAKGLRSALRTETVSWTRRAIREALDRMDKTMALKPAQASDDSDDSLARDDIYAEAIEETTGRLIHELRPIVAAVTYSASRDIDSYHGTQTEMHLNRLTSMLDAIDELNKAARTPRILEFDLSQSLPQLVDQEQLSNEVPVDMIGRSPALVYGDQALVEICVRNGLCNAIEATIALSSDRAVTLSWDETDVEYWVAILDRGGGLPMERSQMKQIGSTTKPNHLGMGLALAERAATSLGGRLTVGDRDGGGTAFELRWPKRYEDVE